MSFGIVFIIFAAIVAILSYAINTLPIYSTPAPVNFVRLTMVTAMMPYLVSAVASFVVAFLTANATKPTDEKILENQIETKPKQETDLEKAAQKEMETS